MDKLEDYIRSNVFDYPTLVLDVEKVEENYKKLKSGLGNAHIHYAVKANPQKEIINKLVKLGCRFDAASAEEIRICLYAGAKPEHISFGNTVKRPKDIEYAYAQGIKLYAADAEEELDKIAKYAPNSEVFIRLLVTNSQAEWPLSRKFGCGQSKAIPLMEHAKSVGLNPIGISFHVGSQTRHPEMWDDTLTYASEVWRDAVSNGFDMKLLNIGGGFPAFYGVPITDSEAYCQLLTQMISNKFGDVEYIMAEPGRGMVGNVGMISANVLLVSTKNEGDEVRWVYLDIGKFNGLAETAEEAIKYQFITPDCHSNDTMSCVLAGPTCDSADVLYEHNKVKFPTDLKSGDRIFIKNCGAYTTTYSTVAFNGFPPLGVVVI